MTIRTHAVLLAAGLISAASPALAWSEKGHQIVGQIAELRCKPKTLEAVRRVLRDPKNTSKIVRGKDFPGTLMEAGTWPDDLRGQGIEGDETSFEFLKLYPDPRPWHYINFPLGIKSADQFADFRKAGAPDILSQIELCERVLVREPAAAGKMTERDALRWLTHIGDLHQPLHVACGFYRGMKPPVVSDPVEARSAMHDRGGNALFYEGNKTLHSYWDLLTVDSAMNTAGFSDITAYSKALAGDTPTEKLDGPISKLTAKWVLEDVRAAGKVYAGLKYAGPHFNDRQELNGQVIVLPATYAVDSSGIAVRQLERAGTRLASLLDRIYRQ